MELRAIALMDLGLSGKDFGRNTHRTLGSLIDRLKIIRQLEDFRAGQICTIIAAGIPRGDSSRTFTPEDFFPSLRTQQERKEPTPDEFRAFFRAVKENK